MEEKWNFKLALRDTLKEKYESEHIRIVEIFDIVNGRSLPKKEYDEES